MSPDRLTAASSAKHFPALMASRAARAPSMAMLNGPGEWGQTLTDSKGRVAILAGSVVDNIMTLTQTFGRERQRRRLALQPDGALRETVGLSGDFGKTFVSGGPKSDLVWRRRAAP